MAEGGKLNWGAVLAGAAIVTGIVSALVFYPPALELASDLTGRAFDSIGQFIMGLANDSGALGKAAVLLPAAAIGGWVGKRAAEVGQSAQDLSDSVRGR